MRPGVQRSPRVAITRALAASWSLGLPRTMPSGALYSGIRRRVAPGAYSPLPGFFPGGLVRLKDPTAVRFRSSRDGFPAALGFKMPGELYHVPANLKKPDAPIHSAHRGRWKMGLAPWAALARASLVISSSHDWSIDRNTPPQERGRSR